jgi:transcriptional regulator with XRE-family HTH domain
MTITPTAVPTARETPLSEQVAEEIRALLGRRRMSGRQLAVALRVSPSWINYRLTGRQPIDLNDLNRIARALRVPVVELFPSDLRKEARQPYPVIAGKPISRRPPTFGQPSGRSPGPGRPPGHPTRALQRAA